MIICGSTSISTEFQNIFVTPEDHIAFQNMDLGKKIRNNSFWVLVPACIFPFWLLKHVHIFQLCGFHFVLFFFAEMTFKLRSLNGPLATQVLACIDLLHGLGISNSKMLTCMLLIHFSCMSFIFGCYSQFFSICRWSIWEVWRWVKDAWLALHKPVW